MGVKCYVTPNIIFCLLSGSKTPHVLPPRNSHIHVSLLFSRLVPPAVICGSSEAREKNRHTSIGVAVSRSEVM